jgi:hypothetical protein
MAGVLVTTTQLQLCDVSKGKENMVVIFVLMMLFTMHM